MLLWTLEAALRIRPALSSSVHNQTNGLEIKSSRQKSLHRFQFQGMESRLHQIRVSFFGPRSPKFLRTTFLHDYVRDDEYVTSVAATAFVIHSLEERNLQKMRESPKSSRTQTTRRKENDISRRPSYGETSMKRSFGQDPRTQESAFPARRPSGVSSPRPVSPALGYQKQQGVPLQHKNVKTRPETWDKAMIKIIQKQYEKMKSKILSRECVKKIQAKAQRAMEMQNYENNIARADMIARAGLGDKRRKESEARKKTNKNRKTSKVLVKCLCFNS